MLALLREELATQDVYF